MGVAILLMALGALLYTLRFIWRKLAEKVSSHKVKNKLRASEEEELYAHVVDELYNGVRRKGLWGKALAQANGSENRAKSIYLRLRVESLKDEAYVIDSLSHNKQATPYIEEVEEEETTEKIICRTGALVAFILSSVLILLLAFSFNIRASLWVLVIAIAFSITISFSLVNEGSEQKFSFAKFFVALIVCSWFCVFFDVTSELLAWYFVVALSSYFALIRKDKNDILAEYFTIFPKMFFLLAFGFFSMIFIWFGGTANWPWMSEWAWLSVILLSFVCTVIRALYKNYLLTKNIGTKYRLQK